MIKNLIDFFIAVGFLLLQFLCLANGFLKFLQLKPYTINTGFIKFLIGKFRSDNILETAEL